MRGKGVGDAAQDGKLVRALRQQRQVLANLHAIGIGGDRLELAPVGLGRVRLQVEGVHVAGPATQAHKDRSLGLARKRCAAALLQRRARHAGGCGLPGLAEEMLEGHPHAEAADGTDAEEVAAWYAIAVKGRVFHGLVLGVWEAGGLLGW